MPKDWEYKPASDLGLPPQERLKSVRREPGLLSWGAHHAAIAVLRAYFFTYHRLTVRGRERLPTHPPFVVIANHTSHFDALVLAAALPRSARAAAFPVAAGDAFFTSVILSAFSAAFINALPLWRKKVTTHAMADLRRRLEDGSSGFILFPEGTRSRDGRSLPFKAGLGMLVAGAPVPVIPCYLDGAFRALPPGAAIPRPVRLEVRVGEPMSFAGTTNDREGWMHVAERARAAVFALAP